MGRYKPNIDIIIYISYPIREDKDKYLSIYLFVSDIFLYGSSYPNSYLNAGGFYISSSSPIIKNSVFVNNLGRALFIDGESRPVIRDTVFIGNNVGSTRQGGAIAMILSAGINGALSISNSSFYNNTMVSY